MKKSIICLVVVCLLCAGVAYAGAPLEETDFVFAYGDQEFALGGPAQALLDAVGDMNMFEADSCMFDGKDREYENDELVLATYPIGPGGADQLETVLVIGGAHQTARAIGIGSTRAEVEAVYGTDYTLDYDQMVYAMGDPLTAPLLMFTLDLDTDTVVAFALMRNTGA